MRVSRMTSCALPIVVLLGAVAMGCGRMGSAPTNVAITAADYSFSGVPDTIEAGLVQVTLVNTGETEHEAWFLKVKDGTTRAAVVDSLSAINRGGAFPSFMLAATGAHPVKPGEKATTTFNLTPGSYFVLCDEATQPGTRRPGTLHFKRGMIVPLEVTGTGGTELPEAEDTLTARDYSFDTSQLDAGRHTILFRNLGPEQWHFAVILAFAPGTTKRQAEEAMTRLFRTRQPGTQVQVLSVAEAASPGYGNTFTATFTKGRVYAVADFMSDRAGGPPHAIGQHMWKVFAVD